MLDDEGKVIPRAIWREESDDYAGEVFRRGRHRVIICPQGLQWIVQRQRCSKAGHRRWRSLHYCTTRAALVRLWHGEEPGCGPIPALDNLPARAVLMNRGR
ncbi:MAG: hypothetical protein Q4G14_06755 [Paracoccus sp. (in: a-proteobacteria)]|uniref:hypothetical protein n=1 Tax=Paracoccus sp. TaxID=267 RepID=UPI0026DF85E7|nr:hypothetical protein [Paracoccus sp. (in: a-proteobacteria)]MDO5612927.1 hypothetical protein [Paracoccus sp. (in: a-proteobacteria)]